MNKKLFLSLAAAGATLLSCSDAVVETDGYNSPIETMANLTVKAQNAVNGTMLSQVDGLQMVFPDRVGRQLPSGAFVFDNVYVGNYNVIVSATGYATVNANVGIGANEVEDVHIARDSIRIVPIYPLVSSLEGYVYYPNKEGIEIPADSVTVQLHFTGSNCVLHKRIYDATAKTDGSGKYVISSLPAIGPGVQGCSYTLYALGGKTGNMPFQTAVLNTGLKDTPPLPYNLSSGTTKNSAGIRVISNNTSVFVVSNYDEVVADSLRDSSITFKFSDKIDMQTVNIETISYAPEIVAVTWTDSSVTLKPVGRWSGDFNVSFSGLKSVTGKSLEQTSYPVIVHKPNISQAAIIAFDKLTATGSLRVNNWIDLIDTAARTQTKQDSVADTNSKIKLSWSSVPGAEEGYDIFIKYETENNYKKIADAGEEDSSVVVNLGSPIENKKLRFLVQAKNSQYKSILDDANALLVVDNSSPTKRVLYDTTLVPKEVPETVDVFVGDEADGSLKGSYELVSSMGAQAVDRIYKVKITFAEDMDIKTLPTLDTIVAVNPLDPLKVAAILKLDAVSPIPEWTDKNELTVRIKVKASANPSGSALDAKFTIRGLKDKSGNPFVAEYIEKNSKDDVTDVYTKVIRKNDLVVRITAGI